MITKVINTDLDIASGEAILPGTRITIRQLLAQLDTKSLSRDMDIDLEKLDNLIEFLSTKIPQENIYKKDCPHCGQVEFTNSNNNFCWYCLQDLS